MTKFPDVFTSVPSPINSGLGSERTLEKDFDRVFRDDSVVLNLSKFDPKYQAELEREIEKQLGWIV